MKRSVASLTKIVLVSASLILGQNVWAHHFGDFVWFDENKNGLQDPGEPGIGGVLVEVVDCASGAVVAHRTTSANGFYQFYSPSWFNGYSYYINVFGEQEYATNIDWRVPYGGPYKLRFTAPAGLDFTIPNQPGILDPFQNQADYLTRRAFPNEYINNSKADSSGETVCFNFPANAADGAFYQDENLDAGLVIATPPCVPETDICCDNNVNAGQLITQILPSGDIQVTFIQTLNDNTYGTNAVGWPNGHKFSDLVGSDQATFEFKNANGVVVLKFQLDYISQTPTSLYPSGWGTFGVTNKEGKMLIGSALQVLAYTTSLTENLNKVPFVNDVAKYIVNSPAPSDPNYPLWDSRNIYSVTVSKDAFGAAGFGSVTITAVHNSPAKLACNHPRLCTIPCPAGIGDFVWEDTNENGLQDAGEPGVPNATVQLLDCTGKLLQTTNTDATGHYLFSPLLPGSYMVKFILPSGYVFTVPDVGMNDAIDSDANQVTGKTGCYTLAEGEFNLSVDAGLIPPPLKLTKEADKSNILLGDTVTFTYTVENTSPNPIGDINIVDDNGTPSDPSDDFIVATGISLNPGESQSFSVPRQLSTIGMCQVISGKSTLIGALTVLPLMNGDIQVIYRQSRNVVDNSYGNTTVGWPRGHSFNNLVGSDMAEFRLTDGNGKIVLDFKVDYISAASKTIWPSGFGTLGVSGAEGKMLVGNKANLYDINTTITKDLNQSPAFYGFIVNSPPDPTPGWDFVDGYEFKVKAAAFGANGFGKVTIPVVHNSPSKFGFNAFYPVPCDSCLVNTATATGTLPAGQITVTANAQVCVKVQ